MPLGTRVKINVLDPSGKLIRVILRCPRERQGKWYVFYAGGRYRVSLDPCRAEELSIRLWDRMLK